MSYFYLEQMLEYANRDVAAFYNKPLLKPELEVVDKIDNVRVGISSDGRILGRYIKKGDRDIVRVIPSASMEVMTHEAVHAYHQRYNSSVVAASEKNSRGADDFFEKKEELKKMQSEGADHSLVCRKTVSLAETYSEFWNSSIAFQAGIEMVAYGHIASLEFVKDTPLVERFLEMEFDEHPRVDISAIKNPLRRMTPFDILSIVEQGGWDSLMDFHMEALDKAGAQGRLYAASVSKDLSSAQVHVEVDETPERFYVLGYVDCCAKSSYFTLSDQVSLFESDVVESGREFIDQTDQLRRKLTKAIIEAQEKQ